MQAGLSPEAELKQRYAALKATSMGLTQIEPLETYLKDYMEESGLNREAAVAEILESLREMRLK